MSVRVAINGFAVAIRALTPNVSGVDFKFVAKKATRHRVAGLPTIWTILTMTFATRRIGSGIVIFALDVLRQ